MSDTTNKTPVQQLNSKRALIRLNIQRADGEIKIVLASPIDWSVFANKDKGVFKLGGRECFYPKINNDSLSESGVKGLFSTDPYFMIENQPNLSLLLAKDLKGGVTFNFGAVPIPESKLATYINSFKEQVKTLYHLYLKPVDVSVNITTELVERSTGE